MALIRKIPSRYQITDSNHCGTGLKVPIED